MLILLLLLHSLLLFSTSSASLLLSLPLSGSEGPVMLLYDIIVMLAYVKLMCFLKALMLRISSRSRLLTSST